MDLRENNSKNRWKNRELMSSLDFAVSISLVIAFEIVNSAIENVVDLASDYHFSMLAKNAKDMAAGAVLFVSGFALLTGLIIFVPKIWNFIF